MRKKLGFKRDLPVPQEFLLAENDPFSPKFKLPAGTTAKELLTYLIAEQQRYFGRTILAQFSYFTLLRHMNLLKEKYSADDIKRGIAISVRYARHPASTKYIEECIEWLRALNTPGKTDSKASEKNITSNKY